MTTQAAAERYESEHVSEWQNKGWAFFNPKGKSELELPVIFGFNNGGSYGWMSAVLIAEDGTVLGGHCCTSEGYMPHDLGVLEGARPDRHERFREHYADGYRMEFVGFDAVKSNTKLMAAIAIADAKPKESESA